MKTTKIVFIGAGSMSFGLSMFKDVFSCQELRGSTFSLVDIDKDNLQRMYDFALKLNEVSGLGLKIEKTTQRRDVLPGAEFVVNSLALERCELWRKDFLIPKKYGIRHTLGENGGPGGLFFTMRTIPVIMDIVRDMEELCPNAYFFNFSNPESRIILALGRYSRIKSMGLCHGIFGGMGSVAKILGRDVDSIEVVGAGLNHFQWLVNVVDKETGRDLYPEIREKAEKCDPKFNPLSKKLFEIFGMYPSCGDGHIGEYLSYGWESGEEGYDFNEDAKYRVWLSEHIRDWTSGKEPVEGLLTPSGERAVHAITGIVNNKKTVIEAGIVYNQGAIANLPADLAVEVPVMVDRAGLHPISVGNLPDAAAKLLLQQASVQQLSVDAAVNGSREIALQALLIDPVINSISAAEKILEELWEINKPYIRKCI